MSSTALEVGSKRSDTVTPATPATLPSYTPAQPVSPIPDDKIAYQSPSDEKAVVQDDKATPIVYSDFPEVVPEGQTETIPKDAPADNQNLPMNTHTPAPEQQWAQDRQWNQTPVQTPPPQAYGAPVYSQQGYNNTPQTMDSTPALPPRATDPQTQDRGAPTTTMTDTVTPLRLLGDQPDTIDCPFCRRRTETKVKKHASKMTHIGAVALFFSTLVGAIFPYTCHCCPNIGHYCQNCGRKVAYKERGVDEIQVFGTPDHLREPSKFPESAPPPAKKK